VTVRVRRYRIRIAAVDADGRATQWRVISGMGPEMRNHGQFDSLSAAVAFVETAKKSSPGETDEPTTRPRP
jgi:hypothetical protein